ncbi:MAG: ATP-binding protein [bacterium]
MSPKLEVIQTSNVKVVSAMMRLLFIIVIPLFIISILRFIQSGWLPVMYLHTFLILCITTFNFCGSKINIRIQENFMILCFVLLGLGAMIHNGSIIFGSSFYLIALIFTMLFHSTREVIILAVLIFITEFSFVLSTREVISIQDYLFLVSLPVLSVFAVYVVNHMRSTLLQTIEQLNLAKDEAQQAALAKSQFLAVMSHEIRTPLNGIILGADLLSGKAITSADTEHINVIKKSSETLLGIVNDILDFSKIDAGKVEVKKHPVDLSQLCRQTLDMFKCNERDNEVDFSVDENFPQYVLTDFIKIRQIVLNLLGNAFKFTQEGMVSLSLSSAQFNDKSDEVEVCLSVSDTGIGIDSKNLSSLFQDFHQVNSSMTREYGGTGLGLWITKKLVQLLDGDINVKSELGEGTCFECKFRMKVAKSEDLPTKTTPTKSNKVLELDNIEQLSLLIVEDNHINQLLLVQSLKRWKIGTIEVAANGIIALEKCREHKFDLIFMDIQMPIMDGVEATRGIRIGDAGPDNMNSLIIALTANTREEDVKKYFEVGMNDYLSKPISIATLKKTLEKYLSNKQFD